MYLDVFVHIAKYNVFEAVFVLYLKVQIRSVFALLNTIPNTLKYTCIYKRNKYIPYLWVFARANTS